MINRTDNNFTRESGALASLMIKACAIFILIILTRSITSGDSNSSSSDDSGPKSIFAIFEQSVDCSEFNDNFEGCVDAENSGKGCSWYANCRLCVRGSKLTEADFKEMCAAAAAAKK